MLCFLYTETFLHIVGFAHRKQQHVVGLLHTETVTQTVFITCFDGITQHMKKKQSPEGFGRDAVLKYFTKNKAPFY